jgi:hypothetical protein
MTPPARVAGHDRTHPADARVRRLLALAPPIFIAHWLEERPGFVTWFNAHAAPPITQQLFTSVNVTALAITLAVVAAEWGGRSAASLALAVAWLGFLMLANAVLHVGGALADGAYVPGLVTALVLYLPYCAWLGAAVARSGRVRPALLAGVAAVATVPMLVHGYRIVFLGSRLF